MIDTNFLTTGQNYLKIGRHFRIDLVVNPSYFHFSLRALAQKIQEFSRGELHFCTIVMWFENVSRFEVNHYIEPGESFSL